MTEQSDPQNHPRETGADQPSQAAYKEPGRMTPRLREQNANEEAARGELAQDERENPPDEESQRAAPLYDQMERTAGNADGR